MVMRKILLNFLAVLGTFYVDVCFAAPNPPAPAAPPPPGVPLDTSLFILMVAGIAYFIIDKKRRNKNAKLNL